MSAWDDLKSSCHGYFRWKGAGGGGGGREVNLFIVKKDF